MNLCRKIALLIAAIISTAVAVANPPKVVVNIVVGAMRAEDMNRYHNGFGEGGFKRLMRGVSYAAGEYNFMQTTTPATLATLTTGAQPSTHGIVADHWYDYVSNKRIDLIYDRSVAGFGYNDSNGRYSPTNLLAPTLGDALHASSPESRIVTVALDPVSAIVSGGRQGVAYWLEQSRLTWTSSTHYMISLPAWVEEYNRSHINMSFIDAWSLVRPTSIYVNRRRGVVNIPTAKRNSQQTTLKTIGLTTVFTPEKASDMLAYTPAGVSATFAYAKQLFTKYHLGEDNAPDILNIVLDAPRNIAEAYGPESLEYEDMLYRTDDALAEFLTYLFAQINEQDVLVVLTSDHGTSPSYDAAPKPMERINMLQSEVIINGFLNARHGQGSWVTEITNRSIWLNHVLIYNKGLNLAEVQEEVASFVMQFRGVSHTLSSTAMRSSYFGSGYGEKMQNGFYPRRSGDVVLNLMPGWIEQDNRRRSMSGSMYGYDTNVPLLFYGNGLPHRRVDSIEDMTSVAPTIAARLGIMPPAANEGEQLEEVTQASTTKRE